jgi:hypothetical protein
MNLLAVARPALRVRKFLLNSIGVLLEASMTHCLLLES